MLQVVTISFDGYFWPTFQVSNPLSAANPEPLVKTEPYRFSHSNLAKSGKTAARRPPQFKWLLGQYPCFSRLIWQRNVNFGKNPRKTAPGRQEPVFISNCSPGNGRSDLHFFGVLHTCLTTRRFSGLNDSNGSDLGETFRMRTNRGHHWSVTE